MRMRISAGIMSRFLALGLALPLCIVAGCASAALPADRGFAESQIVYGLSIARSGHSVLRSRTEYDAFLARYAPSTMGVPPPVGAPPDFSQWAVVVISTRDWACVARRSDVAGISFLSPVENRDTQVVIVSPGPIDTACRRRGSRIESLWVRQDRPVVLFSTMQHKDSTIYDWVGRDLMDGRTQCEWWKLTGFDERRTPVCK
jgi:hypothetical protein